MKKLIILLFAFVFVNFANAQSYTMTPGGVFLNTKESGGVSSFYTNNEYGDIIIDAQTSNYTPAQGHLPHIQLSPAITSTVIVGDSSSHTQRRKLIVYGSAGFRGAIDAQAVYADDYYLINEDDAVSVTDLLVQLILKEQEQEQRIALLEQKVQQLENPNSGGGNSGIVVTMGTSAASKTIDSQGKATSVTYVIPMTLTSSGGILFLPQSAEWAISSSVDDGANAKALAFTLQSPVNPNGNITTTGGSTFLKGGTSNGQVVSTFGSSNAPIQNLGYRLDDGTARNFTLYITATAGSGVGNATDSLRVALKSLKFYTNDSLTEGETVFALLPTENFRTGFETLIR